MASKMASNVIFKMASKWHPVILTSWCLCPCVSSSHRVLICGTHWVLLSDCVLLEHCTTHFTVSSLTLWGQLPGHEDTKWKLMMRSEGLLPTALGVGHHGQDSLGPPQTFGQLVAWPTVYLKLHHRSWARASQLNCHKNPTHKDCEIKVTAPEFGLQTNR